MATRFHSVNGRGCGHPDLAGCVLTFTNPLKHVPHQPLDSLHPIQRGGIGDLTGSREMRVFDVTLPPVRYKPLADAGTM